MHRRNKDRPPSRPLEAEYSNAVFLRSDMIGGCAVILVVDVVTGWISARLRLRLWLTRSTLVVVTLVVGYLLRDAFVPECNKPSHIKPSHINPRGVCGIAIGISAAPIHTG